MKKLSTAQMNLLEQIAKKGETGMYVVSHFPPLKRLLEAGMIQATKIKGGLGTTSDHYVATPLGVVALGGTVGLKEPVKPVLKPPVKARDRPVEDKQKSHVAITRVAFDKADMPPGTVTFSFKVTKPHSEALKRLVEAAVAYGTIPRARSLNSLTEDLKKAAQDMADEVLK